MKRIKLSELLGLIGAVICLALIAYMHVTEEPEFRFPGYEKTKPDLSETGTPVLDKVENTIEKNETPE